jgi:hypothetical protein
VTIPKVIAQRYGIEPGSDIEWLPAGEAIRVVPNADRRLGPDRVRRLELFDRAIERQLERQSGRGAAAPAAERGWHREDLYARGRAG